MPLVEEAAGYTSEAIHYFDEAVFYRRCFTQQNLPTRAENYRLNVYRSISLQILLWPLVLQFSELAVWAFPLCWHT